MDKFMLMAYKEALKAFRAGEVPVGCVIEKDGIVISRAHNEREKRQSAICHAEVLAIDRACKRLHSFRLEGCNMYLTLEPCPMCTGAIINSRLKSLHFATSDSHYGCAGSRYNLTSDKSFEHVVEVERGEMEEECTLLLKSFFEKVRDKNRAKSFLEKYISYTKTQKEVFSKNLQKNDKKCKKIKKNTLFLIKIDDFTLNSFIFCDEREQGFCKYILEITGSFDVFLVLSEEDDETCLDEALSHFKKGTQVKIISSDGKKIVRI